MTVFILQFSAYFGTLFQIKMLLFSIQHRVNKGSNPCQPRVKQPNITQQLGSSSFDPLLFKCTAHSVYIFPQCIALRLYFKCAEWPEMKTFVRTSIHKRWTLLKKAMRKLWNWKLLSCQTGTEAVYVIVKQYCFSFLNIKVSGWYISICPHNKNSKTRIYKKTILLDFASSFLFSFNVKKNIYSVYTHSFDVCSNFFSNVILHNKTNFSTFYIIKEKKTFKLSKSLASYSTHKKNVWPICTIGNVELSSWNMIFTYNDFWKNRKKSLFWHKSQQIFSWSCDSGTQMGMKYLVVLVQNLTRSFSLIKTRCMKALFTIIKWLIDYYTTQHGIVTIKQRLWSCLFI